VVGARQVEHGLVGVLIGVPVRAGLEVGGGVLPVPVGAVEAPHEPDALVVVGVHHGKLEHDRPRRHHRALELVDLGVALLPLLAGNEVEYPNGQHVLVVRAVEQADASGCGQSLADAPQVVVAQFLIAGLAESGQLDALRIDQPHDVPRDAALARGVEPLHDDEHRSGAARASLRV